MKPRPTNARGSAAVGLLFFGALIKQLWNLGSMFWHLIFGNSQRNMKGGAVVWPPHKPGLLSRNRAQNTVYIYIHTRIHLE